MVQDWDTQNASQIATELCGFVTILSGTFLLHRTKDMGSKPPEPAVHPIPQLPNSTDDEDLSTSTDETLESHQVWTSFLSGQHATSVSPTFPLPS